MPTSTIEDYVKQVFLIQQKQPGLPVPMGRLSEAMGITPGTTTTMVKSMADHGLIEYIPRVGVRLTRDGENLALGVLRRHRIAEAFLVRILGMDWAEVHEDAERLEHAISPRVLERMDALLNRPTHDPHGDPIPATDGDFREAHHASLAETAEGQTVVVSRIMDQSQSFLTFIGKAGLSPGVVITVLDYNHDAESMLVRAGDGPVLALSFRVAAKVAVAPHAPPARRGKPGA
ncbi:MAG TPA: metal-dependent transcriptional regulator [Kiritimatiellia bacterium]|nr:metal-dependent transcriptional regulator [Kiritimatiellia bacterium]HMO99397.1 metal-dependent transcriptional regulator [Kiritimatiellia bacterium]HMP97608.1 metal-dependent transcriptional regulator [Kiritimatiellia bacterium]